MSKIGFIGVGNMGGALAKAVCKAVGGQDVYVADFWPEKAMTLSKELGCTVADNEMIAKCCDYIFLGVKPQVLPVVLEELKGALAENPSAVLVSMAAGIRTESIEQVLGRVPIVRIMPNTPVAVERGVILYAVNHAITSAEEEGFTKLLVCAGMLDKLPEALIDAGSAVSGCGPAFVYMFIEALADGGVAAGLPRDKAQQYAAHTVLGAAELLLSSGKHPGELKDAVCSPAGSTIEGVLTLERAGFRDATAAAVKASFERTKQLGKS